MLREKGSNKGNEQKERGKKSKTIAVVRKMLKEKDAEVFFLLTYTWKRGMHFRQKKREGGKKKKKGSQSSQFVTK